MINENSDRQYYQVGYKFFHSIYTTARSFFLLLQNWFQLHSTAF